MLPILVPRFHRFQILFKDFPELNILNHKQLEYFFQSKTVDIVINCAAYTAVDEAENHSEEAEKLNSDAVYALCKFSKIMGLNSSIFLQTMFLTEQPLNPTKKMNISNPLEYMVEQKLTERPS